MSPVNVRRMTDEQLGDLLALAKDSDTVELKLTVPESDHRSAIAALGIDPLDAQIRQVFFFDTPQLTLNKAGLVPRARRIQGKGDDSVVKLRPVVPSELPPKVRNSRNLGVEVDAMPGGYVCSASMKGVPPNDIRQVTLAGGPISKLFAKEQRDFYAANAPAGVGLDDLEILGPINVFKLKFKPEGYEGRLVAELWFYPNNTRILEISTKCLPAETLHTALELRLFLSKQGIDLSGEQQTKTKTALEFFARERAKAAAGS
jgi:hypothetical protein